MFPAFVPIDSKSNRLCRSKYLGEKIFLHLFQLIQNPIVSIDLFVTINRRKPLAELNARETIASMNRMIFTVYCNQCDTK